MPIPFKFDSCKNFATNLNAVNLLGLASKKVFKTLHTQQYLSFLDFYFSSNIKKEKSI